MRPVLPRHWPSSRFVNDEWLRRLGLLAWDDVICLPMAVICFGTYSA